MKKEGLIYTIFSVLALIIVIIGIVFAWKSWNDEKYINKENNTLNN